MSNRWFENLSDDEQGFYFALHGFIGTNDKLKGFWNGFLREHSNIAKIMELPFEDRKKIAEELKRIDEQILSMRKIDDIARLDMEFHLILATAAGDAQTVEDWKNNLEKRKTFYNKIWRSIGRRSSHHIALCSARAKIHHAIGTDDQEEGRTAALVAIQRYFAVLLFHYVNGYK
jgi:DNA-binding GntR family transcriptional regulator